MKNEVLWTVTPLCLVQLRDAIYEYASNLKMNLAHSSESQQIYTSLHDVTCHKTVLVPYRPSSHFDKLSSCTSPRFELFSKKIKATIDCGQRLLLCNVISHAESAAICRQPQTVFRKHFATGGTASLASAGNNQAVKC